MYDSDEQLSKVPIVKRWLMLISDIKEEVLKYKTLSPAKRAWITERLNIINSTQNLLTFPGAKEK